MRRECSERPVVVLFLATVAGLATAYSPWSWLYALALVPLLANRKAWLALAAGLLLGVSLRPELPAPIVVPGGVFEGEAAIAGVPGVTRKGYSAVAEAQGRRYLLWLGPDELVSMGDVVRLRADVLPFDDPRFARRGATAILRPQGAVERVREGHAFWRAGLSLRESFRALTSSYGDPRTAPVLDALCFNVTSGISPALFEALRRSGTVHIVSTSGLHVVIVAAALAFALARVPVARSWRLVALAALLLLYAAAAGFRPPIVRAVSMVLVGLAAYMFRREPDGLSAVAASGTGFLVWSPESLGEAGFQLSYVATAALVMFAPRRSWDEGEPYGLAQGGLDVAHVSLVASLATAPLLAYHFGEVPVVGVLSNVLIAAPVAVAIVGSLAAWAVSTIWLGLAVGLLRLVVEPMAAWIMLVVRTTSAWPWSSVSLPPPSEAWIVAVYALGALLWRPYFRPA